MSRRRKHPYQLVCWSLHLSHTWFRCKSKNNNRVTVQPLARKGWCDSLLWKTSQRWCYQREWDTSGIRVRINNIPFFSSSTRFKRIRTGSFVDRKPFVDSFHSSFGFRSVKKGIESIGLRLLLVKHGITAKLNTWHHLGLDQNEKGYAHPSTVTIESWWSETYTLFLTLPPFFLSKWYRIKRDIGIGDIVSLSLFQCVIFFFFINKDTMYNIERSY